MITGIAGEPVTRPIGSAAQEPVATTAALTVTDEAALNTCFLRLAEHESRQLHRLMYGGEVSEATASEADYHLAALLIKGGIRKPDQVERIMRGAEIARDSGRRSKWSRKDYLQRTVKAAGKNFNGRAGTEMAEEQQASRAAEKVRSRSLGEILKDPNAQQAPAAVVPGMAWAGRITLVAAREGVGKSTLFSAGAAAVTTGSSFLDEPSIKGTVLWVLVEEHVNDFVIRALRFQTAKGDELQILERPDEPLAALESEVARLKPTLVIVDTLHAFAAPLVKDKSQSDDWLTVMAALDRIARTTNTAVLMAAQALKSTGEYRDSGSIGHGVDVVLNLLRPDKTSSVRVLERQKARWNLPDLHIELTDEGFRRTSAKEASQGRRDEVHAALTNEWQAVEQITLMLPNRKQRGVHRDLTALYESGRADRQGTGKKGDAYRFKILAQDASACASLGTHVRQHESQMLAGANDSNRQQPALDDDLLPF